jgi:hypothetical protein
VKCVSPWLPSARLAPECPAWAWLSSVTEISLGVKDEVSLSRIVSATLMICSSGEAGAKVKQYLFLFFTVSHP